MIPLGLALEYASENLRSDPEVVLAAVNNYGSALHWASEELRSDHEVVLAAVNNDKDGPPGVVLQYASAELRFDRQVVLAAVNSNGRSLQYTSEELRSDPEVILSTAKENSPSLRYAMGDLLSCTTSESIEFVETLLQTLVENDCDFIHPCDGREVLPKLKVILTCLSHKLTAVDDFSDFSFRCDVTPSVLARRWIARLEETQWCLARACQNAKVSMDAQRTMEQFTNIARDYQTARELLTYSNIIYMSMDVCGASVDDGFVDW